MQVMVGGVQNDVADGKVNKSWMNDGRTNMKTILYIPALLIT
jgi:hypothetical protein